MLQRTAVPSKPAAMCAILIDPPEVEWANLFDRNDDPMTGRELLVFHGHAPCVTRRCHGPRAAHDGAASGGGYNGRLLRAAATPRRGAARSRTLAFGPRHRPGMGLHAGGRSRGTRRHRARGAGPPHGA